MSSAPQATSTARAAATRERARRTSATSRSTEAEKAKKVGEVFKSVAGSYDLMNDLMSLGLHRVWKRFTLEMSGVREGSRVLDVASGSGDLALAFAKRAGATGQVWMTDINGAMLAVGRDKLIDAGFFPPLALCDAEKLPVPRRHPSIACRSPSGCAT